MSEYHDHKEGDTEVKTEDVTSDGRLRLWYTLRPDPPHNSLRLDFRWCDDETGAIAASFASFDGAATWCDGYEAATKTNG